MTIIFNMTSVRYVPDWLKVASLSVKGCPLIGFDDKQVDIERLVKMLTLVKIIIIKPESMAKIQVAQKWLEADEEPVGDCSFVLTYSSKFYRVIECVDCAPLPMFLTNNCLILLPFDSQAKSQSDEYLSIQNRFNYVASLIRNFRAAALPIGGEVERQTIEALISERERNSKQQDGNLPKEMNKGDSEPESNSRVPKFKQNIKDCLDFLPVVEKNKVLLSWIQRLGHHAKGLANFGSLLQAFANLEKLRNGQIFTVGSLWECVDKESSQLVNWSSFAQVLAETGNIWLEDYVDFNGHPCRSSQKIVKLDKMVELVLKLKNSRDITAEKLSLYCLPFEQQLFSCENVKAFLDMSGGLPKENDWKVELFEELEKRSFVTLIHDREYGMVLSSLPEKPPLHESYFTSDRNLTIFHNIRYAVKCQPEMVLPCVIVVLCKVLPPQMLWKNGAIFHEASSIIYKFSCIVEDDTNFVEMVVYASREKSVLKKNNIQGSIWIVHSVVSHCLQAFSTENLLNLVTTPSNLVNTERVGLIPHVFGNAKMAHTLIKTHSRTFDTKKPRCQRCLLPVDVVFLLKELSFVVNSNSHSMVCESDTSKLRIPIAQNLQRNFVDILNPDAINLMKLWLNDAEKSEVNSYIELIFQNDEKDGERTTRRKAVGKQVQIREKKEIVLERFEFSIAQSQGLNLEFYCFGKNNLEINVSCNGNLCFGVYLFSENGDVPEDLAYVSIFTDSPLTTFTRFDETQANVWNTGAHDITMDIKCPYLVEAMGLKNNDCKIYPAVIHEIDIANDSALVVVDLGSDRESGWRPLKSNTLFPVGFMKYLDLNKAALKEFRENCLVEFKIKPSFKIEYLNINYLEEPDQSSNEALGNIFEEQNGNSETNYKNIPSLPLSLLSKQHLCGFPIEFDSNSTKNCPQSLSKKLHGLLLVLEEEQEKYYKELDYFCGHGFAFVPLPSPLLKKHLINPSRCLTGESIIPNFLCCSKNIIHFLNESMPPDLFPKKVAFCLTPLHSYFLILRMMEQPSFLPEQIDKIFVKLHQQGFESCEIEKSLRNSIFPFLLDYYLYKCFQLCLADIDMHKQNLLAMSHATRQESSSITSSDTWIEIYKETVSTYERLLDLGIGSFHEADLNPLSFQIESRVCRAQYDDNKGDENSIHILCIKHYFHVESYLMRKKNDNYEKLIFFEKFPNVLERFGNNYDSLMTTLVCFPDNAIDNVPRTHPLVTDMHFGRCELSKVPEYVPLLQNLTELILRENSLTTLPVEMKNLKQTLLSLDISLNNFSGKIPEVVFELVCLRCLRAEFLNLEEISENIGNLDQLRILSLRSNCIIRLPKNITKLTLLQTLDLSSVPLLPVNTDYLEEMHAFFRKFKYSGDVQTTINDWINRNLQDVVQRQRFDEKAVEKLNNFIFSPASNIKRLEGYEESFGFPMELFELENLKELSLSYVAVKIIPDEVEKLKQLTRLDLTGCLSLKTISSKIASCPVELLSLKNCPLLSTPPAEIRKRGFAATTAYFKRLAMGSVNVQRTKLMFVGLGGAGKSSLANAIMSHSNKNLVNKSSNQNIPVTDGIDITDWDVTAPNGSTVNFCLWDFAGQVVYYNTHQFFLSNRAIYLLMWNIRLGHEHAGLDFWLSSISCHAPDAAVLVVGTHADLVPEERSFMPEKYYLNRFPFIEGFFYVSSHTGQNIKLLREEILKCALKQKHMGEAIPQAWLSFEKKLSERRHKTLSHALRNELLKTNQSIVLVSEIVKIADSCGIYDIDELEQALQFFTDLGSIQYFKTDFLRDRVIINPQWIVDVLACIVSVQKSEHIKLGKLRHVDLDILWQAYPSELRPWLLKLTEAFDLTFPMKSEKASIVPCMLPENQPADLMWPSLDDNPNHRQTELLLKFKYIPTGLFNRAQVRLCQISEAKMWRRGSVLKKGLHYALIVHLENNSVAIKVQGPQPENLSFLILEMFDALIIENFSGIQLPEYLFSCPECVQTRISPPSMFERSRIKRASEKLIPTMQCFHHFHQIPTRELRHLLPAENVADFDYQLSRTVQQLHGIQHNLGNDILVIGHSSDEYETGQFVNAREIFADLTKLLPKKKVALISDPENSTFETISLTARSSSLIVCCLSKTFMENENCQAALLYAYETLKKPVQLILVRNYDIGNNEALSFFVGGQVYIKAVNRDRYNASDVAETCRRRLEESERIKSTEMKKYPQVFLSYCWQNSKEAIDKGTKPRNGSVGVTDPRNLKTFIREKVNVDCWIDIEQAGRTTLFEDIAAGLRHAKVVVVCVSDEYVDSKNCVREFRFATAACQLPVILCIVRNTNSSFYFFYLNDFIGWNRDGLETKRS